MKRRCRTNIPLRLRIGWRRQRPLPGARQYPDRVILGADTVVALGKESIGKPRSVDEAVRTLQRLRGVEHRVITAVAAAKFNQNAAAAPRLWTRVAVTRVWMRVYSDAEIRDYVATGDLLTRPAATRCSTRVFVRSRGSMAVS